MKIMGDPTKLFQELAQAQMEFTPIPKAKEGQVGAQRFRYADYNTIVRCVRPALAAHGIAFVQPLHWEDGRAVSTTILAGHGATVASSFAFKADFTRTLKDGSIRDDPQEFGKVHTYYRRYQLQSMLGIEGDKDADDLPDVNDEQVQHVEKERKSSPRLAPPPAPVPPAPVIEAAGETVKGTEKEAPAQLDANTLNTLLAEAMDILKWKMSDVKAFYKEHVDPAGFEKPSSMTLEQKRALHDKMREMHTALPPF